MAANIIADPTAALIGRLELVPYPKIAKVVIQPPAINSKKDTATKNVWPGVTTL